MKKTIPKNKKLVLFALVLVIALVGIISYKAIFKTKEVDIEKLLKTESYAYLPKEAKNYIEKVYKETGRILLTEKNKQENKSYLNPKYINYLVGKENQKEKSKGNGYVPNETVIDFSYNKKLYKDVSPFPSEFDLRNINGDSYITPLKDQGNLGICWAFATNEVVESKIMLSTNQPYSNSTEVFSERQLDYGMSYNGIKDYSNYIVTRELGDGSNFLTTAAFLSLGLGTVDSSKFPYNDGNYDKKELYEVLNYANSKYEIDGTIDFASGDITDLDEEDKQMYLNTIKSYITTNGGAFVGTESPGGSCSIYDGSRFVIYDNLECSSYDSGHAMQIIGWDDDYEYDMCYIQDSSARYMEAYNGQTNCIERRKGSGVWILRNSWGSDEGSTIKYSYPYLAYESLYSQISVVTDLSKMSERTWESSNGNYEYDRVYGDEDNIYEFHITKTSTNQDKIEKIKIYEWNSLYNYKVYAKNIGENYVYLGEIDTTYSGLYTLDVSDKNFIINGNEYYLKFELDYSGDFDFNVFTSSVENTPSVETEDVSYRNSLNISDTTKYVMRVYSETRNIPSNDRITYKLFDSSNNDLTSKISYDKNIVSINNVNTILYIDSSVPKGTYTLKTYYNGIETGTSLIKILTELHKIDGEGTVNNPYVITTPDELAMIEEAPDASYILGNNIDLTYDTTNPNGLFYNNGYGWTPISTFSGTFDGKGYSIKGLHSVEGGIFYHVSNYPTDRDVVIKNIKLVDFNSAEALIGYVYDREEADYKITIENISVENMDFDSDEHFYWVSSFIYAIVGEGSNVKINNIFVSSNTDMEVDRAGMFTYINTNEPVDISNYQFIGKAEYAISETGYDLVSNISNVVSVMQNDGYGTLKMLFKYDQDEFGSRRQKLYESRKFTKDFKDTWGSDTLQSIKRVYTTGKLPEDYESVISDGNITVENVYKKNITELTNANLYSEWPEFNKYWKLETIDGIPRIPILKVANFEYTSFSKTNIEVGVGEDFDLKTLITPDIELAKNVTYTIANTNIVTIDNGVIRGKKAGTTTIHVVSNYDGYENDLTVTVQGEGYTVKFDPNGGDGTMDDFTAPTGKSTTLPIATFTRVGYKFIGWSTTSSGEVEYIDKAEITDIAPRDGEITLHAVWEELPEDIYKLNEYSLMGSNILTGITEETSVDDFEYNLEICSLCTLEVYDKDGNRLNYNENVGTGTTTKIYKNGVLQVEFINLVYGDVTGDGIVNIADVIKLADHTVTYDILTEIEQIAAEVTHDSLLTIADVIKLADYTVDKTIELWR